MLLRTAFAYALHQIGIIPILAVLFVMSASAAAEASTSLPAVPLNPVSSSIRVIDATPAIDASDGYDAHNRLWRVTMTPNGDGRNEVVRVRACARRGMPLELRVFNRRGLWFNDSVTRGVAQSASASAGICAVGFRVVNLSWQGVSVRRALRTRPGSYVLKVCRVRPERTTELADSKCAMTRVIAHVTLGYGRLLSARSIAPGSRVKFELFTDRPGTVVSLSSADGREAPPAVLATVAVKGTGRVRGSIVVPRNLTSGLWHLWFARPGRGVFLTIPFVVNAGGVLPTSAAQRALVVWPTYTFAAYDSFDSDRDGTGDSWYTSLGDSDTVSLLPVYEGRGSALTESGATDLSPNARWLARSRQQSASNSVTDTDLAAMSVDDLHHYTTLVFPGHEEYQEAAVVSAVRQYRDEGGNLMMLSANNMYRNVVVDENANAITNNEYRNPSQNDYSITGIGLRSCGITIEMSLRMTFLTGRTPSLPGWALAGTSVSGGSRYLSVSGEADGIDPLRSPAETRGLAIGDQLPADVGSCRRSDTAATMVLSRFTPAGGTVFASGNMGFGRNLASARDAGVAEAILDNLWSRLVLGVAPPVLPVSRDGTVATSSLQAAAARAQARWTQLWSPAARIFRRRVIVHDVRSIDPDALLARVRRRHGRCVSAAERAAVAQVRTWRRALPTDATAVDNDVEAVAQQQGRSADSITILQRAAHSRARRRLAGTPQCR